MTGHLIKEAENINQILWADAELASVEISYDCVTLKLQESTGQIKLVCCSGYIGYEAVGLWDEVVISRATLYPTHELIDRSVKSMIKRLGEPLPDSGCVYRNRREWNLLQIQFIDGSDINVVTAGISVNLVG